MRASVWVFAIFGIGTQVVLVAFFAARRWAFRRAGLLGYVAYALAALGAPVAAWLLASGEGPRLWAGPLILALWAVLGAALDVWLKVEWRDPMRPTLLVPYVTLYVVAQMFLWWPLWGLARGAWAAFAALFVANSALNLAGHFGGGARVMPDNAGSTRNVSTRRRRRR